MSQKKFDSAPQQSQDQEKGRVYNDDSAFIESDLFKLKLANAKKNVAIQDSGQVELENVEHMHFWRTFDSDGRKMIHSVPVAGHFHEITYEEGKPGEPVKVLKCSGPLRMGTQKVRGQVKVVPIPVHEDLEDHHTHEIEYIRSHKVQPRVINAQAQQVIGNEAVRNSTIPGIVG